MSYNPERNTITWAGILFQGVMDAEFFSAEHQEDDVMLHVGAQGFTTFVENANKSGIITVTLSQKSPTNRLLTAAFNTKIAGPFLMKDDVTDGTLVDGQLTRIQKHAPIKRGKEIIGMEWKFLASKLILVAGGDL